MSTHTIQHFCSLSEEAGLMNELTSELCDTTGNSIGGDSWLSSARSVAAGKDKRTVTEQRLKEQENPARPVKAHIMALRQNVVL